MKLIVIWFLISFCLNVFANEKVLLILDQQGSLNKTAALLKIGIEIALKHSKKQLQIKVTTLNSGNDVKTTSENLEKAIALERPDFIIGGITSNHALAIGEIAERERIIFLTPFATHPLVTEGKNYVFRGCFDDNAQVLILSNYIRDQKKLKRGMILYNKDQSYSQNIKDAFVSALEKESRFQIEIKGVSSEKDIDTAMLSAIKKFSPDFFVIPSYQIEAATILKKLNEVMNPTAIYFGTDSWGGGRLFLNITKNISFNGVYVQHWSHSYKSKANKKFLKYLRDYKIPTEFQFEGTAMNAPIAIGYDTMNILLTVAGSKNALERLKKLKTLKLKGATGNINFINSQTPKKSVFLFSINGHEEKFLKELRHD